MLKDSTPRTEEFSSEVMMVPTYNLNASPTSVMGGLSTASVVHLLGKFVPGAGFGNGLVHAVESVNAIKVTDDTAMLKIPDNGTTRVLENLTAADVLTHDEAKEPSKGYGVHPPNDE